QYGAEPRLLVARAPSRSRIGAEIDRADGLPGSGRASDDAFTDGQAERAPLRRLKAVRCDVVDDRAVGVEETDPTSRAAHEARDGAADGVERRREIQPGGDQLARPIEGGELVGTLHDLGMEP